MKQSATKHTSNRDGNENPRMALAWTSTSTPNPSRSAALTGHAMSLYLNKPDDDSATVPTKRRKKRSASAVPLCFLHVATTRLLRAPAPPATAPSARL